MYIAVLGQTGAHGKQLNKEQNNRKTSKINSHNIYQKQWQYDKHYTGMNLWW